jgi:arabinofuranan 3-O-arabinosyltransferase
MDAVRSPRERFLFILLVLIIAVTASAAYAVPYGLKDMGLDYRVFWRAATGPIETLYRPGHMPFVYPPTAIPLFEPLGMISSGPGYFVWTAISVLAFGAAVAAVVNWRVAILSLASPAAVKGIILGQSAMLLAAGLYAAVRLPALASGALFGLVLAVKPQIALFAPLAFLVRRDWRTLQGMVASVLILLLASIALFGIDVWEAWIRALPEFRAVLIHDGVLSRVITPAGRAEHAGLPSWPFVLGGLAIGAAAVATLARKVENEELVGLIVASSLIASPYAHVHDSIALMPVCLMLMWRRPWWLALLAGVIFVGRPNATMLALTIAVTAVAIVALVRERRQAAGAMPIS